jgi:hypothetical protein
MAGVLQISPKYLPPHMPRSRCFAYGVAHSLVDYRPTSRPSGKRIGGVVANKTIDEEYSMHRIRIRTSFYALVAAAAGYVVANCPAQQFDNSKPVRNPSQVSQPQFQKSAPNSYPTTIQSTGSHWSQNLLSERSHDFGAVARASKQEYIFEFKNPLDSTLFLTAVRTSCGCTKPTVLTPVVKPGEIAKVHAKYDTIGHKGERSATVTLSLRRDQPFVEYSEVQFLVKGKIRQDVVTSPGEIIFGEVLRGETAQRTMKVMYAGDPRWRIVDVRSSNPNLSVKANQTQRNSQSGRVDYELVITLREGQPIGTFSDELLLITNDVRNQNLPINTSGRIKPIVETSPIQLGLISKGQDVKKRLILRGVRAFRVTDVIPHDNRIRFDEVEGEKSLHILEYAVDTTEVGLIHGEITIKTSDPDQPEAKVPFSAQVVPQTFASGN